MVGDLDPVGEVADRARVEVAVPALEVPGLAGADAHRRVQRDVADVDVLADRAGAAGVLQRIASGRTEASEGATEAEHALTSGTIKAMLSGPGQFAENETNEVNFREIPSHVLQKVCMYFTYKVTS